MINKLNSLFESHNFQCTDKQLRQFELFYDILIEWNNKMNLTAITEKNEVAVKHFFDSITPAFYYNFSNQKIIDIGAGAGFPSIPLKICFPDLQMTLLDSLNKRIIFLEHLVKMLELKDITLIHGRAEEVARQSDHREKYDIAISRAVAKINIISELSLPFISVGGNMISLKGPNSEEELADAKNALYLLGGKLFANKNILLPDNYGERNIVIISKVKTTSSKFPRKPGVPARQPL